MHIPPYHKKRNWQIFSIGVFSGTIVAYFILLFMYGEMYANILTEISEIKAEKQQLERQNEALLRDQEQLQTENEWIVQSIHVQFTNSREFRFDRLTAHQLGEQIKDELKDVIGKDVKSVAENSELIETLIEKSVFTIDELSYSFEIKKLVFSEQITIDLYIKFAT